jgi:hypothetical protein
MTLEERIRKKKEWIHKRIDELPDTPETELLLDKIQRILEGTLDAAEPELDSSA